MPELGTSGSVGAPGEQSPGATRHLTLRPQPRTTFVVRGSLLSVKWLDLTPVSACVTR